MAITCFGELLLRLTPPGSRLVVQSESLELHVGGAEANVAVALANLGHEVRFVGLVSDNALGDRAVAALRMAGVDAQYLNRAPGRMGLYFMENGAGPRLSAITYDRTGSAFVEADKSLIDFAAALNGAPLLHTGGITPALGPKGVLLAKAAQAAALSAGVPICFDGNYRGALWSSWNSNPGVVLRELVADATILFGNHRDISLLLGKAFSGDGPEKRRAAAEAAFETFPNLQLIASTARHIVNPDRHRIAARVDKRDAAHQTAEIEVTGVIERIGTGDAFAAGILHAWLDGGNIQAMAETGLALMALKHTIPGDMCLVNRACLQRFSASSGDVRR